MYRLAFVCLISALFCNACAQETDCTQGGSVVPDDARPDVLVVGDSISYGWLPALQQQVPGLQFVHNPGNGRDSRYGSKCIGHWLSLRPHWHAIIFNHGAWDVSPRRHVSGSDYQGYMRHEAWAIRARTEHPIFLYTTSVPAHDITRYVGSEIAYNRIAQAIMTEFGVPTVDLWSLSMQHEDLRQHADLQNDVHWTPAGSAYFADAVLAELTAEGLLP